MKANAPHIGFDRFIRLDWADTALRVRSGLADITELDQILTEAHAGLGAKKKTRTVLNRLWLEPREEVSGLAQRGVDIFSQVPDAQVAVLTWGMALAVYPFFAKTAEFVGRLTSIQGDCTTAEVHRRMAEIYGEREGTRRMTNMVLQSQVDWSLLSRSENGRTLTRRPSVTVQSPETVQWISEAVLMHVGRPLSLDGISGQPTLFPFSLGDNLGYVFSSSDSLDVRADSSGTRIVGLKHR
ncbi:hypothetical protein [Rubellimicrobium mesophilum]|uniref:hypothetical protein n=1 Tax=Rubellimicrobium mesophilum TaxID=1123067 RepID=UPI0009E6B637|nr:hypothetical protein [Rubellimicrobium mesophilum]